MAKAVQVSTNTKGGGSTHTVGFGDLRVMICQDGEKEWYAQGLEIDYLAQGTSLEDVKKSFECGLEATIEAHLRLYGDISNLLRPAPPDVWVEALSQAASGHYRYTQVSTHQLAVPATTKVLAASTAKPARRKKKAKPALQQAQHPSMHGLPFHGIAYLTQCAA